MGIIAVLVVAAASYGWGAAWYTAMARPWMTANGLMQETVNRAKPTPYIVSLVATVLVAGMTRHIMATSGIKTVGGGLMTGAGLGLFVAVPWIVTNYGFAGRPRSLMLIDGAYAAVGCTIIGVVLGLFVG